MSKYKVDITGINTSNLEVLKNTEMLDLFLEYQGGDLLAKERLVNGNLKLVLSIIKKYNNGKYDMNDLFQIGCVGLIKAVDNFDISFGVQFSTYAVPLILGEVKRFIRDSKEVRVARSIRDNAYKILQFKDDYLLKNGMEPTNEIICKSLNISDYELQLSLDSLKEPMSIFEPIYNDGGDTIYLFDQVEDKDSSCDLDIRLAVDKAISNLNEREQFILDQRFVIGKTQMEIAEEIGISQAQISRLEKNALQRVRKQL